MIYKLMEGRLGNQMFQYAAMRAYMLKYHEDKMVLNFNAGDGAAFGDQLKDFNVIKYDTVKNSFGSKIKISQRIIALKIKITRRNIVSKYGDSSESRAAFAKFEKENREKFMNNGFYYSMFGGAFDFESAEVPTKIFMGNFESPGFFDDYRDEIIEEFVPKKEKLEKNFGLYREIERSNSVCVTIRRGDFVDNPNFKKTHYVCTPKYFEMGMEIIKKKLIDPRFFVFSDDIKWVQTHMKFPKDTLFESGDDPVWEKLRLMSSCKNFIISNSTFSWWAQYLSENKNKIVVAPSIWKNNFQNDELYGSDWVLIDIKKIRES